MAMTPEDLQAGFAAWAAAEHELLAPFLGHERFSVADAVAHDKPLQRALYDAGWARYGWPESAGGLGGDCTLRAAYYDALYAAGLRVPEAMLALETVAPALHHFAPHLSERFLAGYLRHDDVWCQGFSEPEAGSDLASLRCRAVDAGDHFVVNGQKIWTSFGQLAQRCILLVRTGAPDSAHRGLTMLFVDLDSPGITPRAITCAGGRDDLAEVFYDDVAVPKDRLVGEVGQGWAVAMYLLQWERGMYAYQRQSFLHARLDELVRHPHLPPGAAARIGEAYELLFSLRVKAGETVRRLAAGETPGPEISVDKILLATAEQAVLDLGRELLYPALELDGDESAGVWRWEWWYSRAASIYGGAGEVQRNILAERVLGLPR